MLICVWGKPPHMSELVLKFCTESDQYPIALQRWKEHTTTIQSQKTNQFMTIFTSLSTWIIKALNAEPLLQLL